MNNLNLAILTDVELKTLKDSIVEEQLDRKEKKIKELKEALEKSWREIEEAGLNIYAKNDIYERERIYLEEFEIS